VWALARAPVAERRWLSLIAVFVGIDYGLFVNAGATLAAESESVLLRTTIIIVVLLVGAALIAFDQMLSSMSGRSHDHDRPSDHRSDPVASRRIRVVVLAGVGIVLTQCLLASLLDGPLRRAERGSLDRERNARAAVLLSSNATAVARANLQISALERPVAAAQQALLQTDSAARRATDKRTVDGLRTLQVERRAELRRLREKITRQLPQLQLERDMLKQTADSTIRALEGAREYTPSAARRVMRLPEYLPWSVLLSLVLLPLPVLPVVLRSRRTLTGVNTLLAAERRVLTLRAYRALTYRYADSMREYSAHFRPRAHPFSDAPWNLAAQHRVFVPLAQVLPDLVGGTGAPAAGSEASTASIIGRAFFICRTARLGGATGFGGNVEELARTTDTQAEITHASIAPSPTFESLEGRSTLRLPLISRAHVTTNERDSDGPWAETDLRDVIVLDPIVVHRACSSDGRVIGVTGLLVQALC